MTIGYHSPMPPAKTGVAAYSEALVRGLRRQCRVEVNPAGRFDHQVYNIGNNRLHREIHERAVRDPGVILLHDACLHHFYLGAYDREAYVREFVYNYGDWHRDLAHRLWTDRTRSGSDDAYFRYPMLRRILERAQAVVVHNPAAARVVREHRPDAVVAEIPHLFEPPAAPPPYDVARLRSGWPRYVFGAFGHLRESKRLPATLRAFDALWRQRGDVGFLLAGEIESGDLARALEPWSRHPAVIRVPYLPEPGFWLHAHAVDACVNLRYPSVAETSGIAIRLMGIGKPVILNSGEESAFPDTACLRVDPGPAEHEMLLAWMTLLASDAGVAARIGEEARIHIAKYHSVDVIVSRLIGTVVSAGTVPIGG